MRHESEREHLTGVEMYRAHQPEFVLADIENVHRSPALYFYGIDTRERGFHIRRVRPFCALGYRSPGFQSIFGSGFFLPHFTIVDGAMIRTRTNCLLQTQSQQSDFVPPKPGYRLIKAAS